MSTKYFLTKNMGIISIFTLLSRILGFLRDLAIAYSSGVYLYAQAFVVAFRIPNLFRDLFAEGLTNSSFVPVFTEYLNKEPKEFWELARAVLFLLILAVSVITVLGIIFSPLIVNLIAPGFHADIEKMNITIKLTRFFFPYLIFVSLSAYAMGILNSLKHFFFPALSPCLLNISLILSLLLFKETAKGLILGVLVGGIMQFLIQVPMLYIKGFRFSFPKVIFHPGAKKIIKLMFPRLFSSAIYYLNNFVDTIFGSFVKIVGEGGVAGLYFSYRLIQFPLGVFSTALFQASLPVFSVQALESQYQNLKETLIFALRMIFFVLLPISIYFMFFSQEIITLIFKTGKFDDYSVRLCSGILSFYSLGLSMYGANKVLQGCFFSLKDTLTPTRISFLAVVINVALNFIFIFPLKIKGIALATSLSGFVSFFCLLFILNKRLMGLNLKVLRERFLRILFASTFSALGVKWLFRFFIISYQSLYSRILGGLILIFLLMTSFVAFCFILKVKELQEFFSWILKRQ